MTPTVFGYVALFTALLAGAAAAVEWGMQGRFATRHFWTAAILLAVLAPPATLAWRAAASTSIAPIPGAASDEVTFVLNPQHNASIRSVALPNARPRLTVLLTTAREALAALSRPSQRLVSIAVSVWALLSFALIVWLAIGVFHWRRVRRAWKPTTLDGVEIDVSPFTGPAVLGFLSHRIVLPTWATTMPPEHRRLVLAHECEHISARDPQRLALGIAALVLMPWNIGLWWCAARLRRAIELDCDARVLRRFPSAKDYGYVLLEVAARGRNTGPLAIPMVGLLRLPSELELRLRAITRPRSARARTIAAGSALAFVAIGAAFTTPVPTVQTEGAPVPRTLTSPLRVAVGDSSRRTLSGRLAVPTILMQRVWIQSATHVDTVPKSKTNAVTSGAEVDSINVLLRQYQQMSAELEVTRVRLESVAVALRTAERSLSLPDSTRAAIESARPHFSGIVETNTNVLRPRAPISPEEARRRSDDAAITRAQIDSAIARTYPDIAAHPSVPAVLWFVADSAGHVIRAKRDGELRAPVSSTDGLRTQFFLGVDPGSIESVVVMKKMIGHTNLSVTWIRVKTHASE